MIRLNFDTLLHHWLVLLHYREVCLLHYQLKSLLPYRGGCLLHYRLNLLHYREVLHYRLIFITLSGSITLSGVYYIIGCNNQLIYLQIIAKLI